MCDFQFYLSLVKDFAVILASLTAAIVAILGLNRWKKELKGKIYFDFSRQFLKSLYTIRDVLHDIRSAFIRSNEFKPDYNPRPGKKTDSLEERENQYYIFKNRLNKLSDPIIAFNSQMAEAEALFGPKFREDCQQIVSIVHHYQHAVDEHLQRLNTDDDHYRKNIYPVVFRTSEDAIDIKIREAISNIEESLLPFLKR